MTEEYKKVELLPAQKEFLEVPHEFGLDVALYQGGFGSGKTFCGAYLGVKLCEKYPGIRGLVGAQTFTLVRDTTLQTYFEHLDYLGYKEKRDYWYKSSEHKLVFKNGSEILFRSFDEPNKIKSLNLGFVEVEEMSDVKFSTFKMLIGRLRQAIKPEWAAVGFKYRLFGHTNPEAQKGWVYKTFVENKKPNYRRIIAPTTENKFLSQDYIDGMKDLYDKDYYNIYVKGQDGNYTSGLVVKGFTGENIHPIAYQPDMDLHITCDFNVDPMCWVLAHITTDDKGNKEKVFYFDEIVIENTTTLECIKEFCERYPNHQSNIIINGDASGDNRSCTSEFTNYVIIQNYLKQFGYPESRIKFELRPFNPPIKNRIAAVNAKVLNANGERCLFVSPKCERMIYNCQNLMYKVGTSKIDLPTHHQIKQDRDLKFLGHIYDAFSYLIEYYWSVMPVYDEQPQEQENHISQNNFNHLLKNRERN